MNIHGPRLSMLSSGANSCSLAEQSFGKGPLYPLFTTGSSSLVAGTGRGQLSSRFFNQSTDPNFLVSESGLIFHGRVKFLFLDTTDSLALVVTLLQCLVFNPISCYEHRFRLRAGALARPTADPCWLLWGTSCRPDKPGY